MHVKELKRYIPSFLFFVLICYLILLRDLDKKNMIIHVGQSIPFGDKIGHFFLFGMLTFLLNIATQFRKIDFRRFGMYLAPILVLTFAIAEEFTQILFPSRSFDIHDMVFDLLGIAFFTFLSKMSYRKRVKQYFWGVIAPILELSFKK